MHLTDTASLFAASVRVFAHYNTRILALLNRIEDETHLSYSLTENALTTGDHFKTAQGFVLRTLGPLTGKDFGALEPDDISLRSLKERANAVKSILDALAPEDFAEAAQKTVAHRAGFADVTQTGAEFLSLYGLPNFFFHLSMGYAGLRACGVEIGKGDFDGIHQYPAGFHW